MEYHLLQHAQACSSGAGVKGMWQFYLIPWPSNQYSIIIQLTRVNWHNEHTMDISVLECFAIYQYLKRGPNLFQFISKYFFSLLGLAYFTPLGCSLRFKFFLAV